MGGIRDRSLISVAFSRFGYMLLAPRLSSTHGSVAQPCRTVHGWLYNPSETVCVQNTRGAKQPIKIFGRFESDVITTRLGRVTAWASLFHNFRGLVDQRLRSCTVLGNRSCKRDQRSACMLLRPFEIRASSLRAQIADCCRVPSRTLGRSRRIACSGPC